MQAVILILIGESSDIYSIVGVLLIPCSVGLDIRRGIYKFLQPMGSKVLLPCGGSFIGTL
jgi:hypothetical protein